MKMKTVILWASALLLLTSAISTSAPAGYDPMTGQANIDAYDTANSAFGGRRTSSPSSSYSSSYSYEWRTYSTNPCAGLGRLERALCNQGRRIEGF
jgi:hypothetical protein